MAQQLEIKSVRLKNDSASLVRIRGSDRQELEKHLFQRYPNREWGTFFRYGWRRTPWGVAIFYVDGLWPESGDLERQTPLTTFREQYSRRAFQVARESNGLGLGVIHSHPAGYGTVPSALDDDMDLYFGREFSTFSGGSPYCSLIFQRSEKRGFTFSGRVYDRGAWLPVTDLITVGQTIERTRSELVQIPPVSELTLLKGKGLAAERLASVMGMPSLRRLQSAVVGVVGCSGTGSPAIEVLARAQVGEFVLVDPQRFGTSNLERIHGSVFKDSEGPEFPYKVDLMRKMILEINPDARVTTFVGNILHENVIDELVRCDIALGCVDSHHGRLAQSDYSKHFLLPSLDIGVRMFGSDSKVSEQTIDITKFGPEYPCAFCGGRINSSELAIELMTEEERQFRQAAAEDAVARGDDPDHYWKQQTRQLHTVGYLTTAAGALGAGYAEGWLTGAFSNPHSSLQFDPSKDHFACVAPPREQAENCTCGRHIGWGEQARSFRNIFVPSHWSKKAVLRNRP